MVGTGFGPNSAPASTRLPSTGLNTPKAEPGLGILGWVQGVLGVPSPGMLGSPRGTFHGRCPPPNPRGCWAPLPAYLGTAVFPGEAWIPSRATLKSPRRCSGPFHSRSVCPPSPKRPPPGPGAGATRPPAPPRGTKPWGPLGGTELLGSLRGSSAPPPRGLPVLGSGFLGWFFFFFPPPIPLTLSGCPGNRVRAGGGAGAARGGAGRPGKGRGRRVGLGTARHGSARLSKARQKARQRCPRSRR